jgi:hypothetical protein
MAEIVNLRRARKRKARVEKEAQAAENRVRFGRRRADKRQSDLECERAARDLDGKKRD